MVSKQNCNRPLDRLTKKKLAGVITKDLVKVNIGSKVARIRSNL